LVVVTCLLLAGLRTYLHPSYCEAGTVAIHKPGPTVEPNALVSARVLIPFRTALDFTARLSNVFVLTHCSLLLAFGRAAAGLAACEVAHPEEGIR